MQMIATFAPFVLLVVPVVVLCIWHVIVRTDASKALAELYRAKGDSLQSTREKYWALDRLQKRVGLALMLFWLVTVVGWRWIGPDFALSWIGPIIASLGLFVMYMWTYHMNMKDSEERIQADVRRRYPIPGEND